MLDLKANIEDVNAALAEVSRELEKKAAASAIDDLRLTQVGRVLNAGVCIVGVG